MEQEKHKIDKLGFFLEQNLIKCLRENKNLQKNDR